MKAAQSFPGPPIGSENSKNKEQKFSDIRKTFDGTKKGVAIGIMKGHLNLNGNSRKRSAEPRPHPAKLLNKRYWDDVRAGRVCPPNAVKEEEGPIVDEAAAKQPTPSKEKFFTKSTAKYGEKRKATAAPLGMEMAAKNAKNSATIQNSLPPFAMPHQPTVPGDFPPPNQSIFQPQSLGIVPTGSALSPQSQQQLLRFASFLPPHQNILRSPGQIFVPPSADAFIPSQFAPSFDSSATAAPPPISNINNNNLNMVIPPLMMLNQHHHQQQFNNSAVAAESATATAWKKLLEMLAKGTAPNGQLRNEQQQFYGIFSGQNVMRSTAAEQEEEAVKNEREMNTAPPPQRSAVGCSQKLSRNSESDAQIDELMDQIARKYEGNVQTDAVERSQQQTQVRNGECRLCFVPIPIPVPVPFPVSTDFILKHFSKMDQQEF